MKIPFNKPFLTGKELEYIQDAVALGKLSGNGKYTKFCQSFFQEKYGFKKCLLTSSCTDALEMCAILANIGPGDEVILPSFTFVSTANAFLLRGAKLVFADSRTDHPGIDEQSLEGLITDKTKAIVVVHYAGVSCDMKQIMELANRHGLIVVEDAAQAIDGYYNYDGVMRPLGSIGHLGAFSFHETKNIISGEGGMLAINDDRFLERSEIIWEKGTNRSSFFRGEVDKYGWVDIGSSFLPSEVVSAFLFAQLENMKSIQDKRKKVWNMYHENIQDRPEVFTKPNIPAYSTNNAHLYYLIAKSGEVRDLLISKMAENGIHSVFHYLSLHKSPLAQANRWSQPHLPMSDSYSDRLVRLPLFYDLKEEEILHIINTINSIEL